MSKPFDDPRAKVENAKDHLARAEAVLKDYVSAHPPFSIHQSAPGMTVVNFGPQGELPKKIPLAIGDALHNLRSALDIMAGDVVQASGKSRKGVQFPFAASREGLDEMITHKKFSRAKPEAVDLLRSLKPYKGGYAKLRALHDLDLTDKHNFIIPASKRTHVTNLTVGTATFIGCEFENIGGADVRSLGAGPLSVGSIDTKLVFAPDQPMAGQEVFHTLHAMTLMVSGIIEAFAKLFVSGSDPA